MEDISAFEHIARMSDALLTLKHEDTGQFETKSARQWREWLIDNEFAISGYGTVFDQSKGQGVIPSILTDWFAQRKHYQKLKGQASKALEELELKNKAP